MTAHGELAALIAEWVKTCRAMSMRFKADDCAAFVMEGDFMPQLIVEAERRGAEKGWDEGEASGWSRAMRNMSDEPSVRRGPNPYRADQTAQATP